MDGFGRIPKLLMWPGVFLMATFFLGGCGSSSSGGGAADLSVPTVISTSPSIGATSVPINQKVVATFSTAMKAATINSSTFTVKGAGEAALTGTVSLVAASNTAHFAPSRDLTANTLYTATITTGAKTRGGKVLTSDFVWTFTSGAGTDSTAPAVSSTNPADGATAVALNSNVTAHFSEALDPATVNTTNFTLTHGATPVAGAATSAGAVATFNPTADLAASTVYTATVTSGVTDLAVPANPLAADVVWSFTTGVAAAAGLAPVDLGTAGDYVILAKSGISTTGVTAIDGNIGVSPAALTAITGFTTTLDGSGQFATDPIVTGVIRASDMAVPTPANLTTSVSDMETAYTDAAGRTLPDATELGAGDISGLTISPGLYKWGTGVLIASDVTLSGSADDVWIFQIAGDLTQENGTSVILNGALAKNVFWQVAGGAGAVIGTTAHFEGVILAQKKITLQTGATINGRLLAQTAVTLDANDVTQPAP
jgi:hypothetical protein